MREELEKQKAKAHYQKLHAEGKTEAARADLARLSIIRKQREEAAKKREDEKKAKEAAKAAKLEETQKALGKKTWRNNPVALIVTRASHVPIEDGGRGGTCREEVNFVMTDWYLRLVLFRRKPHWEKESSWRQLFVGWGKKKQKKKQGLSTSIHNGFNIREICLMQQYLPAHHFTYPAGNNEAD